MRRTRRAGVIWIAGAMAAAAAAPAVRAQEPPEAAPDAGAPRAATIRLPDAEGELAAESGVPRTLVALGGFLLAAPEPPEPLRADGARVVRTKGKETVAALRLPLAAAGEAEVPDAGTDDDTARRLLAIDLDARRPDAAAWLQRVDPARCAVRYRVPRVGDVPSLPDGLQLVEVVGEASDAAGSPVAFALPALPRARRVALYGIALSAESAAAFREAHPRTAFTTTWRETLLPALADCDRARLRVDGIPPRVVDLATGADAVAALVAELVLDEERSGAACPCDGSFVLEFARGPRPAARLAWHRGDVLTWLDGAWPGDARLTADAATKLTQRLADAGLKGPLAVLERQRAADARRRARDRRQDAILGAEGATALRTAAGDEAAAKAADALGARAVALKLAGAAGGERDDPVTLAAWKTLDAAAPARVVETAAAAPDDEELQRGFAIWLWELRSRDFLLDEEKPHLERTARLLAGDEDPEVRVVAVRALRELGQVAALRALLETGDGAVPTTAQIQAAFALVELRDDASLPKIRALLDATEEPLARASLEAALRRAAEPAPAGEEPPK